jgi:hypothetical protein
MVIDSSEGGVGSNNTFAVAVCRCGIPTQDRKPKKLRDENGTIVVLRDANGDYIYEDKAEKPLVLINQVFGFKGKEIREIGMDAVIKAIADEAKNAGCSYVFGDQYGAAFLIPLLRRHGVAMRRFAHSTNSKHEAVLTIRWLMRDRMLQITDHSAMQADLVGYPRRIAGGKILYGHTPKTGHHYDHASSIITMAHALNGISLNGGTVGKDQDGNEYYIEKSVTRHGIGRAESLRDNTIFGRPEQNA